MIIETLHIDANFKNRLKKKVITKLGNASKENEIPLEIRGSVDSAIAFVEKFGKPRAGYRLFPVLRIEKNGVATDAGIIQSKMFAKLVKQCNGNRRIAFMIATLGKAVEKNHENKTAYDQFVYDLTESECIEMAAELFDIKFRKLSRNPNMESTMRFSPGYCDWNLDGQKMVLNAIDAKQLGVKLNSYFVMSPVKTISSVTLVSDEVPLTSPCVFCGKTKCSWRRQPVF